MKYLLKAIRVYKDENDRGAYHWLRAELFVEGNPWANSGTAKVMYNTNEELCKMYLPYGVKDDKASHGKYEQFDIDTAKLQKDITDGAIADLLHVDHVVRCVESLPKPYVRIYKRDQGDHVKGEWVMGKNSEPQVINQLIFYVAQYFDDDDNAWHLSEDPKQIVQRTLENGYKPYNEPVAQQATASASEEPSRPELSEEDKARKAEELKAQLEALGLG